MDASPLQPPSSPTHPGAPPYGPPCPGCGRPRTAEDARGVAWSSHRAPDGTTGWLCPECTRAELRQIEAGLPMAAARRSPAA